MFKCFECLILRQGGRGANSLEVGGGLKGRADLLYFDFKCMVSNLFSISMYSPETGQLGCQLFGGRRRTEETGWANAGPM